MRHWGPSDSGRALGAYLPPSGRLCATVDRLDSGATWYSVSLMPIAKSSMKMLRFTSEVEFAHQTLHEAFAPQDAVTCSVFTNGMRPCSLMPFSSDTSNTIKPLKVSLSPYTPSSPPSQMLIGKASTPFAGK